MTSTPDRSTAPWHAHIYFDAASRPRAEALQARFRAMGEVLFTGELRDHKVGPHPVPQFEIHFLQPALATVRPILEESGLRILVHPLTLDDLSDHTDAGQWIGEPIDLDLTVLDPAGVNQGIARFGRTDF